MQGVIWPASIEVDCRQAEEGTFTSDLIALPFLLSISTRDLQDPPPDIYMHGGVIIVIVRPAI